MEKIKILFEELNKKYPDIITESFVTKLCDSVGDIIESQVTKEVETAVTEALEAKKDELIAEAKSEVTDSLTAMNEEELEKVIDTLDVFLEEAKDSFMNDFSEKIDESIKSNVSFELVEKINEVLESHGIVASNAVVDKDKLEKIISKQNETILSLTEQVNETEDARLKAEAINVVDEICENLNYSDTMKVYKLIEDFEVDDLDSFKKKVSSIVSIVEGKNEDSEDDSDEAEADDDSEESKDSKDSDDEKMAKLRAKKIDKKKVKTDSKEDEDEDDEDATESSKMKKIIGKML